ncbi:unnamed protein product [Gongylonema pulchrum]|uniref:Thermopsin n=1 Tax=Gongylonema pulchrum TaxID=637853 RepID=A0A183DMZ0_9BILA|nr:unnamed protein product [Gongylonema pulchrum]
MDFLELDGYPIPLWTPIYYFNQAFFYVTASVKAGFHYFSATGSYTVFVSGSKNGAAYGYVAAYNSKFVTRLYLL